VEVHPVKDHQIQDRLGVVIRFQGWRAEFFSRIYDCYQSFADFHFVSPQIEEKEEIGDLVPLKYLIKRT
tara:strand:- start:236 stop:442 length:207 start_codon:yes stop_codon:yes gene_type:complete